MSVDPSVKPACLLDASIYIFRYYFSLPDRWHSDEGIGTGAVYGYTGFLLSLLAAQQPRLIGACFDESLTGCFRNELYPAYKSSRTLPDEALAFQLQACRRVTELLGISAFASAVYEADDLIGALMLRLHRQQPGCPVAVLTRDKDLGQLLSRTEDYLWDYAAADAEVAIICRQRVQEKFGVWPEQLPDYLALVGDKIDDIPGVPGVGPKTASALLQRFGSLEELYQRLGEVPSQPLRGAGKVAALLAEYRSQAQLARQLATIATGPEVLDGQGCLALEWTVPDERAFTAFCQEMGFGSAHARRLQRLLDAAA